MTWTPTIAASQIWRDYNTDGVPASGVKEPVKSEIRTHLGEIASRLNVGTWIGVFKQADQTKNSDASLANDSELSFAMEANKKYRIRIQVWFDTAATPDFKFALVGPSSPTLVRVGREHIDPNALTTQIVASEVAYTSSTAVAGGTGTTGGFIDMEILVHNGNNAGTFAFQWAQNTSNASSTIVRAGSSIEYMKITA